MSRTDAVEAVQQMIAAYPQATIPDATLAIYAEKLADIPRELLTAAVARSIDSSRFFPSISELRRSAAGLAGLLPATEAEALAIVRQADISRPVYRRDGTYAYTEREWAWPQDVSEVTMDLVHEVLSQVGEPCDAQGNPHFGWDTGFQKTYARAGEEAALEALADLSCARLRGSNPEQLPPSRERP